MPWGFTDYRSIVHSVLWGMGASTLLMLAAVACWFELSRAGGAVLMTFALFTVGGTAAYTGFWIMNASAELEQLLQRLKKSPALEYQQRQEHYQQQHEPRLFEMVRSAKAAARLRRTPVDDGNSVQHWLP